MSARKDETLGERIRTLARWVIAWSDPIVVASGGDEDLLELEGRPTWRLDYAGDSYEQGLDLITRVEEFRSRGAKFLLLPITHLWWLDRHPQFKQHLEASYRVAARTTDCVVFSLRWPTDADFRNTGAPDGFALPPPELMQLTVAYDNSEMFFRSGQQGAEWIESMLDEYGIQVVSLKAMLDYGCGCGRIIRHWGRYPEVHVVGVDYNPRLTDWCRTHLRFADFETPLAANLAFESEYFDLIYAVSVFTHLDAADQAACLTELTRLLRPGGHLLVTFHGSTRLQKMSHPELALFNEGEMVARNSELSGSNACATFHPERYIREKFASGLELLCIVPGGAKDVDQDAVLLRKAHL